MAFCMGSNGYTIMLQRNQSLLTPWDLHLGMLLYLRKYFADNYCVFKPTIWVCIVSHYFSEFPWFVEKDMWIDWGKNGLSPLSWYLRTESWIEWVEDVFWCCLSHYKYWRYLYYTVILVQEPIMERATSWNQQADRKILNFTERISCFMVWKPKRIVKELSNCFCFFAILGGFTEKLKKDTEISYTFPAPTAV